MIAALALLASFVAPGYAVDCATCAPFFQGLSREVSEKGKYAEIIQKNRDYLARASGVEPSIRIKVNSNILIATLRLEANENRIEALNQQIKQKGCQGCQTLVR